MMFAAGFICQPYKNNPNGSSWQRRSRRSSKWAAPWAAGRAPAYIVFDATAVVERLRGGEGPAAAARRLVPHHLQAGAVRPLLHPTEVLRQGLCKPNTEIGTFKIKPSPIARHQRFALVSLRLLVICFAAS